MELTDWVAIAVIIGILAACFVFDLWIRKRER